MRQLQMTFWFLPALVALACGGGSSSAALRRAVVEVVLSLPADSICALVRVQQMEVGCTEILIHPGIGREHYSNAQAESRPWSTSAQLPGPALEGHSRYRLAPFDMSSLEPGQLGYAVHIQEPHPADSVALWVEIFAAGEATGPLLLSAFAIGEWAGGRWTFELRDIAG